MFSATMFRKACSPGTQKPFMSDSEETPEIHPPAEEEKPKPFIINVHVKEKTIPVHCGDATQRILWLAHVGISRYDSNFGLALGVPKGVQLDHGEVLPNNDIIRQTLADESHVWVVLADDELGKSRLPTIKK